LALKKVARLQLFELGTPGTGGALTAGQLPPPCFATGLVPLFATGSPAELMPLFSVML
jgi:hypothetical protein